MENMRQKQHESAILRPFAARKNAPGAQTGKLPLLIYAEKNYTISPLYFYA